MQHVGARIAFHTGWDSLPWRRVASCGRTVHQSHVDIKCHHGDDGPTAFASGVTTCGSVWACSVCRAKIRTRRQLEVETIARSHSATGRAMSMLTLTVRHGPEHSLLELMTAQAKAWRSLQQDRRWRELRRSDLVGSVRAWEITHGFLNGPHGSWHPHFHVLLLWDRNHVPDLDWVSDAWAERIQHHLGERPSKRHGVDHRRLDADAAGYVAKIGAEMTRADLKGKSAGFDQLVDAIEDGETWAASKVFEYISATKGKRAIQMSRGLRDLYDLDDEKTDEEIAAQEVEGEVIERLRVDDWVRMTRYRRGRPPAAVEYLRRIESEWKPPPRRALAHA